MKKITIRQFNEFLRIQRNIKKQLSEIIMDKFKMKKGEDDVNIETIDVCEAYESDCDGDDNKFICQIVLNLKSSDSKKTFYDYLSNSRYYWKNLKIEKIQDMFYGDQYSLEIEIYI